MKDYMISATEKSMPYPRICAHRGFCTVAPENSLPAFGAAVALGADEIEFDLWATKDGVLVSCHDGTLDRVSDGTGKIYEHTFEELRKLDFGFRHGEAFRGLKIPTLEEILQKFGRRCVMNVHVKIWDDPDREDRLSEIAAMIRKYDCQDHMYFMPRNDDMILKVTEREPDLPCCVGWDGNRDPISIVDRAIALGAKKVQLFKPHFSEESVKKAHAHGILCNVFYSDDPEEARGFRKMGIDTILTNDFWRIKTALTEDRA